MRQHARACIVTKLSSLKPILLLNADIAMCDTGMSHALLVALVEEYGNRCL
jgi:hypothetical protein